MLILIRRSILPLCGFLFCTFLISCKGKESTPSLPNDQGTAKKWNRSVAEEQYSLMTAELALAKKKLTYLVIDLPKKELTLKPEGAVVWSYPIELDTAVSDNLDKFVNKFRGDGDQLIRPLLDKHMFSSKEKSPDSVLAIVSEVVRADVDLMQRHVPERFELLWGKDLIMEVRTEVAGKPQSKFKNTMLEIRQALQRPFGEAHLVLRMDADHALTLYRAADHGLQTLIYPAN